MNPQRANRFFFLLVLSVMFLGWSVFEAGQVKSSSSVRVYGTFWAAGDAANHGKNPYAVYPSTFRMKPAIFGPHQSLELVDPNLSPPCTLPAFQLAALLGPQQGMAILRLGSGIIFIASAVLLFLMREGDLQKRQIAWMLLATYVPDTILIGQDYAVLLVLSVGAWLLIQRGRPDAGAICIGLLAAIKPNFLLWPLFLLLAKRKRMGGMALAAFSVTSALPAAVYGPRIFSEWHRAFPITDHMIFPGDVSLIGYFTRIGLHPVGLAAACALGGYGAWLSATKRASIGEVSALGICASVLCSPLAWVHYALVLVPWAIASRWTKIETAAAVLLMVPVGFLSRYVLISRPMDVLIGLPYLAALGLMTAHALKRFQPRVVPVREAVCAI